MADGIYVTRFSEIGIADRPTVGGKGASLGELASAGIRVPPGCIVTTNAFERFLAEIDPQGSIRREVSQLSAADAEAIAHFSGRVRARIEGEALPADLQTLIADHYNELHSATTGSNQPVAIRSSATSEDSTEASFAGLQDTYLWVRGTSSVIEHVRRCWASLYSIESITYRRKLNLPEDGLAMGVVIQRMIDALCSGVMFTRSPKSGDRSVVVLEASWGLGSAVVSGEVTPDQYVIGKVTGEIVSRKVSTKLREHRPHAEGAGVADLEVPLERQSVACLSDEEIHELVKIAKQVERHYGAPQDIEFAVARDLPPGDNVFLLQSRPETVWAAKEKEPVAAPKKKAFDHVVSLMSGGTAKR
ncbi:MAG: PEP/pyruvate-binding domain-containing protein [Candidatus Sulfotelmatobacter sp.]|jgi:pyruvate,water dikinase